ncbi:M15 family metallopeptidase [Lysinibacillus xylanilyticus]|uniref:M15 family metallopeptidase n=1 Tax=Lysinibacillus xylanilyticus TaxID=582475 RepID=UPI002B24D35A|nr:M15 family metallopeptidase [Lysinibacillus xylanilyticus]MEB2299184.1 M15 family metallopeptidase [Lysinibacillus xylanilyticus]
MRESTPAICENGEPIIQIGEEHSRIFIEPIYYHQKIPNSLQVIYLRQGVYERLTQALLVLPKNFSLILYDGYRPFQVQQFLFAKFSKQIAQLFPHFTEQEVVRETRKYVAFPSIDQAHFAPHLTGGAIDVTLGDLDGNALNLGTAFDEISEKSATRYFEQHPEEDWEACVHRRLLYNCMTMVGFTNYSEEWWHFDLNNVSSARRVGAQEASYGAVEAMIQDNKVKEFRFL